ncbi:hypothetical protein J3R83DRAFT_1140 [Lanmaoa asiatica]|nr:hypothetical protein J3R83DRAFT_1140 [Lanmaoa asiatica]
MATQKALRLPDIGAEFTLEERTIYDPQPGEVLVKLEATAINAVDWKIQKEGFFLVEHYPL